MATDLVTLASLERDYPWITWRVPVRITVPSVGAGLACRVCVAAVGFHGLEAADLPQTQEEFEKHFRDMHDAEPG